MQGFEPALKKKQLSDGKTRNRKFKMSTSEILTITTLFHLSGMRTFKYYHLFYVQKHLQAEFPETVSYNRVVELMQANILPLTLYMKISWLGNCTGISLVDSTRQLICR